MSSSKQILHQLVHRLRNGAPLVRSELLDELNQAYAKRTLEELQEAERVSKRARVVVHNMIAEQDAAAAAAEEDSSDDEPDSPLLRLEIDSEDEAAAIAEAERALAAAPIAYPLPLLAPSFASLSSDSESDSVMGDEDDSKEQQLAAELRAAKVKAAKAAIIDLASDSDSESDSENVPPVADASGVRPSKKWPAAALAVLARLPPKPTENERARAVVLLGPGYTLAQVTSKLQYMRAAEAKERETQEWAAALGKEAIREREARWAAEDAAKGLAGVRVD